MPLIDKTKQYKYPNSLYNYMASPCHCTNHIAINSILHKKQHNQSFQQFFEIGVMFYLSKSRKALTLLTVYLSYNLLRGKLVLQIKNLPLDVTADGQF